MKIINKEWISQESEEAILFVSDGSYICKVFSHPCDKKIGYIFTLPLHAFGVHKIARSKSKQLGISSNSMDLSQHFIARVIDCNKNLVAVGQILIELDIPLYGDANVGDIIEFYCDRVDLL